MSRLALRLATRAVRAWTRLYTWRMDPLVRDVRRAELESDLWEHTRESGNSSILPLEIVLRMMLGAPDDLFWRVEHMNWESSVLRRKFVAIVSSFLLFAAFWLVTLVMPIEAPTPPPAPDLRWRPGKPPPPPPPPPPPLCSPAGIGAPPKWPCSPR